MMYLKNDSEGVRMAPQLWIQLYIGLHSAISQDKLPTDKVSAVVRKNMLKIVCCMKLDSAWNCDRAIWQSNTKLSISMLGASAGAVHAG